MLGLQALCRWDEVEVIWVTVAEATKRNETQDISKGIYFTEVQEQQRKKFNFKTRKLRVKL